MALAVGQHAFMPAVAGLLRSAASRSDWHPSGTVVPLYALSNVARSNATRSGYVGSRSFISIDGIVLPPRTTALDPGILIDSLQITDLLNYEANRCTFVAWGFTPKEGQRITVTLGSVNNRSRLFAGRILNTEQFYQGLPKNLYVSVNAIDDTWGLDARKVSERYTAMTYEAIVKDLLAKYAAPTYTAAVEPGLGGLDEITFTNQDLTSALTQLAKRGGYQWLCDETATIRFFQTDTSGTAPTILNAAHPSLDQFKVQRDLSQLVTRVYVEGGGVNAFAAVAVGETILPVESIEWYPPAGVVVCGPQRIRYTGVYPGGGGGLVGPGASPSGRLILNLVAAAGMSDGPRSYAVTYTTTDGESIASPLAAITTGPLAAPLTAPVVVDRPAPGIGPEAGTHTYVVTYSIDSGETTAGPPLTVTTGTTEAPHAYPIPGTPTLGAGAGVDQGAHEYAISFVTATGETIAGPISPQVIVGTLAAPNVAPSGSAVAGTPGPDPGTHEYVVTFKTAMGETTPGPISAPIATGVIASPPTPFAGFAASQGPTASLAFGTYEYQVTFQNAVGETTPGGISPSATTGAFGPPSDAPGVRLSGYQYQNGPSHKLTPGARYRYGYTYADTNGNETTMSPASVDGIGDPTYGIDVLPAYTNKLGPPPGHLGIVTAHYYRSVNDGPYHRFQSSGSFSSPVYDIYTSDADIATAPGPPTVGTATFTSIRLDLPIGPAGTINRIIYRRFNGGPFDNVWAITDNISTVWIDPGAFVLPGSHPPPSVNTAYVAGKIALVGIPASVSGVTSRGLYRRRVGAGPIFALVAQVSGYTATTYTDGTPDASLGGAAPASNTAALGVVPIVEIPTAASGGGVTGRKLYRRSGGVGLRYVATIGNNSTPTYTDTTPNASLGAAPPSTNTARLSRFKLEEIPIGPPLVRSRNIYRTRANASQLYLLTSLMNNTAKVFVDTITDSELGGAVPVVNTAAANQVMVTGIPVGPPSVTNRKLYRTVAWGANLKLLVVIPDAVPSVTEYLDALPDASLGALAPSVDTSGLQQPAGSVSAGSTSFDIASIGQFPPAGWAVIGNGQQVIRYTAIVGNTMSGIPASGPGSIQAAIAYNSTVTAAPQLVGIPATGDGRIRYLIRKGDEVNLWVQADNLLAQAALAALMGTDGIIEGYLQDRRLSYTESLARAEAQLALRGELEVGISYSTRDVNTRAGRLVTVNLPTQHVVMVDFQLRQVVITRFGIPNLLPTFTASASTDRFSFEALIRAARKDGT